MKRYRPEEEIVERLTADEFCAALNGTDANTIWKILNRFSHQVQLERTIALGGINYDNVDQESGEESDDGVISEKKKLKKSESWKEDKAAYNVPFVGTSSARGDNARVVVGEWPTGLLKAYLAKSPLAVELTSENLTLSDGYIHKSLQRENKTKLSHAIFKSYMRALAELITAAVPIDKFRIFEDETLLTLKTTRTAGTERGAFEFVAEIVKRRITEIFSVLSDETGKGSGRPTIVGGVGPLAPLALRILSNLSLTSVTTARYIVQSLDERLPDGVLRLVFRPQQRKQGKGPPTHLDEKTPRLKARGEALRLARNLIFIGDGLVLSRIVSVGIRERKIRPGLLFVALKEGLIEFDLKRLRSSVFEDHLKIVEHVMLAVWQLLAVPASHTGISRRSHTDLFCLGAISNICAFAVRSPPLSKEATLHSILADTTLDSKLSGFDRTCMAARRIIFLCLGDQQRSPFLSIINKSSKRSDLSQRAVENCVTSLFDNYGGLPTDRLIVECVNRTPALAPIVLGSITFPDHQLLFSSLSRINMVSKVYHAASVSDAIGSSREDGKDYLSRAVGCIIPGKIKKHLLVRIVQGSNGLLAAEVMKLLVLAVERLKSFVTICSIESIVGAVLQRFAAWLPEISTTIIPLLNDSCVKSKGSRDALASTVFLLLTRLVDSGLRFGDSLDIDPCKLVATDSKAFSQNHVYHQLRVIRLIMDLRAKIRSSLSTVLKFALEVTIETRYPAVFKKSHRLAVALVRLANHGSCSEFEAECWVDGASKETIEGFCRLVTDVSKSSFREDVISATAWKEAGLQGTPRASASGLVGLCFRRHEKLGPEISLLACQVATKNMMFLENPLPFAALLSCIDDQKTKPSSCDFLSSTTKFARTVIDLTRDSVSTLHQDSLREVLSALFVDRSSFSRCCMGIQAPGTIISNLVLSDLGREALWLSKQALACSLIFESSTTASLRAFLAPLAPLAMLSLALSPDETGRPYKVDSLPGEKAILELQMASLQTAVGKPLVCDRLPFNGNTVPNMLVSLRFLSAADLLSCVNRLLDNRPASSKIPRIELRACEHGFTELALRLDDAADEDLQEGAARLLAAWLRLDGGNVPVAFLRRLEVCLQKLFERKDLILDAKLVDLSAITILRKCIQSKRLQANANLIPSELLLAMLRSDFYRLGSCVMRHVADTNSIACAAFKAGQLDSVVAEVCSQKDLDFCVEWDVVADEICKRALFRLERGPGSPASTFPNHFLAIFLELDSAHFATVSPATMSSIVGKFLETFQNAEAHTLGATSMAVKLVELGFVLSIPLPLLEDLVRSVFVSCTCQFKQRHSSEAASDSCLDELLTLLQRFLVKLPTIKVGDYQLVSAIAGFVRLALKAGMSSLNRTARLRTARFCITVVNDIVEAPLLYDSSEEDQTSMPRQVFEMVTQHSKFEYIISDADADADANGDSVKAAILNLLRSCTTRAKDIVFDVGVWLSFVRFYGASVSKQDSTVRDLILSYQQTAQQPLFLNMTGPVIQMNQKTSQDSWEWVQEWISLDRVLATISCFPASLSQRNTNIMTSVYEPGYVLTFILAALEDAVPLSHLSRQSESSSILSEELAHRAQALCVNGGLALALGSLCCEDDHTRKTAAIVLLAIRLIAISDAARATTSWRERPQLAMMLDSVQKGIAFNQSSENGDTAGCVPRMPGTSAIFLAKVSLVLTKPGHALYSACNRYFLKIDENGGPFPDLFRLPIFISLFCSATDDIGQSQKERLWALESLRDGFVHEECFRPLLACHAPELLLASFECTKDDHELNILTDILARILEKGGKKACVHMLGRLCLLSWLQRILFCTNSPVLCYFVSNKSICSLSRLLVMAVSKAKTVLPARDFYASTRFFARKMVRFPLFLETGTFTQDTKLLAVNSVCEALINMDGRSEDVRREHPEGCSLSDVIHFLSFLSDTPLEQQFCFQVCRLPVASDSEGWFEFCVTIVEILKLQNHSPEFVKICLRRVAFLCEKHGRSSETSSQGSLLTDILDCRRQCAARRDVYEEWKLCVQALLCLSCIRNSPAGCLANRMVLARNE